MALYDYNVAARYDLVGSTFELRQSNIQSAYLGTENATILPGDTVNTSGSFGPGTSTYYGYAEIGGVDFIFVFYISTYYVYANVSNFTNYEFPTTIPSGDVSTTEFVPCFLPGVQIATPSDAVAVERLAIGDLVLTADGRAVPVKWVGRRSVVILFGPPEDQWPVLVEAGALGEGVPCADLRVTSDHALLIDGVLVQAGALVNGTTIRHLTAAELGERYIVYHVETDGHEIIVADGMPVETFVDNVTRRRFDNYADYVALYGEQGATITEIAAPRVKSARQLPRPIRERVAGRARALRMPGDAAAA
ncbi:Hint domain-containing protein [Pseudoxanthobacter sp. M-2]|uniref:Hint domain-containing protein n=1 Tax=Pseudoxanthobacter sp. M-2 TaxID=3078754 RepID=UPI0038FCA3F0